MAGVPYIMGIDEAGRGPVLGPMVYACAYCKDSEKEKVKALGVQDSKVVKESVRDDLFEKMKTSDFVRYFLDVIWADDMSQKMLRKRKYNLNHISHDSAIDLIRQVIATVEAEGNHLAEVYIDTVGPPESYRAKLSAIFPSLDIVVESKADATYPVVSAASICAKVTRDTVLRDWTFAESAGLAARSEFGSGYPGDPTTKAWLVDHLNPVFGFPTLVRFSWGTCTRLLQDKGIDVDWGDDEEEADQGKKSTKLTAFMSASSSNAKNAAVSKKTPRFRYFSEKKIESVISL